MFNFIRFALIAVMAVLVYACQTDKNQAHQDKTQIYDSVALNYSTLTDSLNHAWDVMINDDNEKLQFMKRLLLEVSYTGSFNEKRFTELMGDLDSLKKMRYESKEALTSKRIDQYDSATNVVTQNIIDFAYGHPQFNKNEMMQELVDDIYAKNSMVLIYRVHYDAFVEERNHLVESHEVMLDTGRINAETLPLFKIPPEEI